MKIDKNTQIGMNRNNSTNFAFGKGPRKFQQQRTLNKDNPTMENPNNANLGAPKPDNQKEQKHDVGQNKVQSSLANRAKNLLNQRTKSLNFFKKKKNSNDNPVQAVDDLIEDTKKKVTRKVIVSILLFLTPIIFIFILFITIVAAIQSLFPFLMPSIVSNDSGLLSESDTSLTSEEKSYYNKLREKESEYSSTCNSELNSNLIHASLIYLYYQEGYSKIDYNSMKNMVDVIYNLMPSSCGNDFEINGVAYNNFKNSAEFNQYYSVLLEKKDIDTILKEIFDLSTYIKLDYTVEKDFIPESTTINIDEKTGTSVSGTVRSGTSSSSSDNQISTITFKEYLTGVIYANVKESDYNNVEKIKSYVIVYTSNALSKGSLSVDTQMISLNDPDNEIQFCHVDKGCSYVVRNNKLYLQIGGGKSGNGNNSFYNGDYYYHRPLDSGTKEALTKIVDEAYGIVLLNKDGKYDFLDPNKINNLEGTYNEVLNKAYKNYTIKNLRENNYVEGIDFYNQRVVIPTIAYDQSDYRDVRFCGRSGPLSSNNIESSGCGVTAIAIVISSYENNNKYDPPYMSEQARIGHYCGNGIYGTLAGIFWNQAAAFGYSVLNVGKYSSTDLNLVLSHLASGHMVITNVGPGTFTRGGHYIVLTGVDPVRQKVYVTDPYDRGNKKSVRKSGSGWYDFNLITKEAYSFYIIVGK